MFSVTNPLIPNSLLSFACRKINLGSCLGYPRAEIVEPENEINISEII